MDFGFLKADVANEVCVGDFAACRYLIFLNGEIVMATVMRLLREGRFADAL